MCLDVKRHLASGHEISKLQQSTVDYGSLHSLINCRPRCNLYLCIAFTVTVSG